MDQKIKVLFLDIDNTLLDFDAGAAWAMNLCFEKAGLKYRPEMFAVFKEENNKIWRRIELGELTMDDLFMCAGRRCFDISDSLRTVWRWKKNFAGFFI